MNRLKIDSEFSVQISEKIENATYATIIKNGSTEIWGSYFPNNTPVSEVKIWAEKTIEKYKKGLL
jgi:hypothetical protein